MFASAIPAAAYADNATGGVTADKVEKKNIKKVVFDLGLQIPIKGGRLFAALKGVVDSGLEIRHNEEALPSDERVAGKHIAEYASKLKADQQKYAKQFSKYIKENINPEEIGSMFDEMKKKVLSV